METVISKGQIVMTFENMTDEELLRYKEIFDALVLCGGLSGVKSGSTNIHFDASGVFQGVQLVYWPYRRRKQ